jgi:hypothetical protein
MRLRRCKLLLYFVLVPSEELGEFGELGDGGCHMSTISSQSFRLKKDIIGILLDSVKGREKEVESL